MRIKVKHKQGNVFLVEGVEEEFWLTLLRLSKCRSKKKRIQKKFMKKQFNIMLKEYLRSLDDISRIAKRE